MKTFAALLLVVSFQAAARTPVVVELFIISFEAGWKPQDLRAVVFVQERSSRRVLGAASAALALQ